MGEGLECLLPPLPRGEGKGEGLQEEALSCYNASMPLDDFGLVDKFLG